MIAGNVWHLAVLEWRSETWIVGGVEAVVEAAVRAPRMKCIRLVSIGAIAIIKCVLNLRKASAAVIL